MAFFSYKQFSFGFSQPAFFGHTGGGIDIEKEDAGVKNRALRDAGAIVPDCFDGIAEELG